MNKKDKYSKGDIIYTKPFGPVIVIQRWKESRHGRDFFSYVIHTFSGSEFQVSHPLVVRLATDNEAVEFKTKYKPSGS
jgi:hypothetical protein